MTGLRLLWLYIRLGVLHELAYRVNFAVQVVASAINLAGSLLFLAVVYSHVDTLAGWALPEMLALWGVFFLLTGLLGTVIQPSLNRFMHDVSQGTLDFVLSKPVDAQVLVSVKHVEVWKLVDVALGVVLLAVALMQLEGRLSLAQAAAFVAALVVGAAIAYSCCLILATMAFWFIRLEDALLLFLSMWEAGRWPVEIYSPGLRIILTFVVPVAFATNMPVETLRSSATPATLVGAAVLAFALLTVSRFLWCRGIRRYSGASA